MTDVIEAMQTRESAVDHILAESHLGLSDFPVDDEILLRLLRAAYAKGYDLALRSADPLSVTVATAMEREGHARLPVG